MFFFCWWWWFKNGWAHPSKQNTVHVITSGVFATYYFMGTPNQDGSVTVAQRNPTAASTKRALTTSFGSICFGSLIIALIQTVRALLRQAANESASEGNLVGAFLAICAECCLSCIEGLLQYFNKVKILTARSSPFSKRAHFCVTSVRLRTSCYLRKGRRSSCALKFAVALQRCGP